MTENIIVLTIGENAPDFSTVDFSEKPVILSKLQSEGPVVLIFLRSFR